MLRQAAARLRPRTLTQLAGHSPTQTVPSGHRIHRQSARWRLPTPPPPTPSTNKAPPRQSSSDPRSRLLLSYHDLERALERRGLNTFRVLLATSAAGLVAATLAWPRIKQWGAVEGAEVAAASLETERLQETAGAMVVEVLADEKTAKQVEMLLGRAVVALFEDKKFTGRAVEWAGAVLAEAVLREEVVTEGARYVQTVFAREDSKESIEAYLAEAVANVAANETVQDTVAQVCHFARCHRLCTSSSCQLAC